jgi:hypothetical protein
MTDLYVWRVYSGRVGFGAIYRVVVAETEKSAMEAATRLGMVDAKEAEVVCKAEDGAGDESDQDG